MPTPTYDLIASNVLSSSASSVTFSSIPATYRDLVLVSNILAFDANQYSATVRLNGDSGSNYSYVAMRGNGSSATSFTATTGGMPFFNAGTTTEAGLYILSILDYSATDKHKTALNRANVTATADPGVSAIAYRWANTAAVSSLAISTSVGSFASGSSFYIYGLVS